MRFFQIKEFDDVFYTGGLPVTPANIEELKKRGISTIVSLEPMSPHVAEFAVEHGIKVVNMPVEWHGKVPESKLKRFLSLAALADGKGEKIFWQRK